MIDKFATAWIEPMSRIRDETVGEQFILVLRETPCLLNLMLWYMNILDNKCSYFVIERFHSLNCTEKTEIHEVVFLKKFYVFLNLIVYLINIFSFELNEIVSFCLVLLFDKLEIKIF